MIKQVNIEEVKIGDYLAGILEDDSTVSNAFDGVFKVDKITNDSWVGSIYNRQGTYYKNSTVKFPTKVKKISILTEAGINKFVKWN